MAKDKKSPGKKNKDSVDLIFQADEMQLRNVEEDWSEEQMLSEAGIFYLKDVANKLRINSADFKKRALDLENDGENAWLVMGIRKAWTHWIVRMTTFKDYYRKSNFPQIKRVDDKWDGNELLSQKGLFYLKEVCEKIPFNAQQIRYQSRRNANAREEYGVWKDPQYKSYIVDMEIFSNWIRNVWLA